MIAIKTKIKCNIVEYSLFVSFFPQLIAGPIIQQWQLIPQLKYKIQKRIDFKEIYVGIARFSIGLFKTMIADSLGIHADKVFGHYATTTESIMWWQILVGVLCYTMQLYFDFSAYSDMAIGVAKIFKIKLPENFNSPYKSQSVKGF